MISVEGLTRAYGSFVAVDDVTFACRPGRVTGFLGPNGAGKTTTMRVLVGLTPPSRGRATIGGLEYRDIQNPGRHVGVLLDAGAQHGGRTGREILTLGALAMGLPTSRVDDMLRLVALTPDEASRRLRHYSLGMKQRLGIAHALLGDPQVLILDEPANGLDPAGIRWMRGLLKGYADRGGTVLLSSHLLHEVEQIADEMILIGRGRIVARGDKKTLLESNRGTRTATTTVVSLDNARLAEVLAERGLAVTPGPAALTVAAEAVDVGRAAAEHQIVLTDLRSVESGLEDLFLELTSATQRDGRPPGTPGSPFPGRPLQGYPAPPGYPPPPGPPSGHAPQQPGAPR
ncbi:ABC transporter ATP-binding protein [Nocardioides dongxiaopingii]|uniref:ABC transporter ATP-binding protein n=1 Tax=Nocardioides dongxiaopingii TaxID=2576036 RepID=UPI0014857675|nr:ATP-binding cassette domain-containing protein [Nocardioides dongxiaopingii]